MHKRFSFIFIIAMVILGMVGGVYATNGDNMIGVSPASRGMGGTGVGMPVGPSDTIFRNPAWMSYYDGFHLSFGGILFMPTVKARIQNPMGDSGWQTSKADTFGVPEVGLITQLSDRLTFGLGMFGVSGMGVDYRNNNDLQSAMGRDLNMHTNFQFMRFIPSVAYKVNDALSIGGGVHLAYGSLDMGAVMCADAADPNTCWNAGGGQSQDFGIGAHLAVAYRINDSIFAGMTYETPLSMTYERLFDSDGDGEYEAMDLTQPQEVAFGVGMIPLDNVKLTADLRWINWSDADGYKDFQWKDQWVIAVGGEYRPIPKLALRAGWNYAKTPIREEDGLQGYPMSDNSIPDFNSPFGDFNIAFFNLIGFPAITEHHITLGLGYEFTESMSVDLAYKHAFEKEVTSKGTYYDMGACSAGCPTTISATNAQDALAVGVNWRF